MRTRVAIGVLALAVVAVTVFAVVQNNRHRGYASTSDSTYSDTLGDRPQSWPAGEYQARGPQPQRGPVAENPRALGPRIGTLTVPAGTRLSVRLRNTLSTKHSYVGEPFTATVTHSVVIGGRTAIPAGATVRGHVAYVHQPGKASGRGNLQLAYDALSVDGQTYRLGTRSTMYESRGGTKKDVEMIGGGAVVGGVLGGILGHGIGGAAKGAVIGGAAGTGASLLTRGPQLTLGAGTVLSFRLDNSVRVRRNLA